MRYKTPVRHVSQEATTLPVVRFAFAPPLIISVAFFIGGAGLLTRCLWWMWIGYRSAQWPRMTGQVVHAWTVLRVPKGIIGRGRRAGFQRWREIRYRYDIAGRSHVGRGIRVTDDIDHGGSYRHVSRDYPIGQSVSVAYNPASPNRSVVEPGIPRQTWAFLACAILFFGLAVFFFTLNREWMDVIGPAADLVPRHWRR